MQRARGFAYTRRMPQLATPRVGSSAGRTRPAPSIRHPLGWGALALGLLAGCPLAPTGVAEGSPCVRSTQCTAGLVCSATGVCTSDLTGFGMGMVPNTDVPMDLDAGDLDAGEPMDVPAMDAPMIPLDVPMVPMDVPMTPDVPADAPTDSGLDSGLPDVPAPPDVPVVVDDAGAEEDAP